MLTTSAPGYRFFKAILYFVNLGTIRWIPNSCAKPERRAPVYCHTLGAFVPGLLLSKRHLLIGKIAVGPSRSKQDATQRQQM